MIGGSFVMLDNVYASEEGKDVVVGGLLNWCMVGRVHLGV